MCKVHKNEGIMQRSSWTRPPAKTMRDMLHIGAPIFAELFLVSLFVMVDTALLKPCGTTAFAAYRILISLQNFGSTLRYFPKIFTFTTR